MSEEVEIHGLRELQERLRQLPRELQGKVLTQALREGGRVIVKDAQGRAPVAVAAHPVGKGKEQVQPGNIRRNIVMRAVKETDSTATVSIGVRSSGKKSNKNAFYWRFLEFGTKFIAARPYMRPAFEARKLEAAQKIKEALAKRIDAAVRKLGG